MRNILLRIILAVTFFTTIESFADDKPPIQPFQFKCGYGLSEPNNTISHDLVQLDKIFAGGSLSLSLFRDGSNERISAIIFFSEKAMREFAGKLGEAIPEGFSVAWIKFETDTTGDLSKRCSYAAPYAFHCGTLSGGLTLGLYKWDSETGSVNSELKIPQRSYFHVQTSVVDRVSFEHGATDGIANLNYLEGDVRIFAGSNSVKIEQTLLLDRNRCESR